MNKIKYMAAIFIAIAGLGLQQAEANLIFDQYFYTNGPIGDPSNDTQYLINNYGASPTLTSLFKENNNSTTDGIFGQYFTITMTTGNSWNISWNLTGSGYILESVLIKNGSPGNTHGLQLYGLYGVTANQTLIGSGTVTFDGSVHNKNISFVEFFGELGDGQVPDGGTTVMLLGAGLSGLGLVGRFLKR